MGDVAERVFGRKNLLELYAVFSSPLLYRVETETRRDLGSLEQAFVDRLVAEMSSVLARRTRVAGCRRRSQRAAWFA